ncbi:unnamed protein product [Leptosia nina]|uniref:Macoilin n=1 Tax=Leptosia nina TaxID=320188 RepID=A0AAV1JQ52_9NEOP
MRRPIKRTKIPEGMYGNSITYVKFLMSWAVIVVADYMLEFRFEFLYLLWILIRSLYDSFKFQGLACTIIFLCMVLISDMIFFFVIPLQYIYFLAGTYVWVQHVWSTVGEKGVCLQTLALCCLVIYTESTLRSRGMLPELCRPLAAHCIGYPAMTFGFGLKSYLNQRLRQRRQRQVRAENEFYFQLLRDALPESALEQVQYLKNQQGSKEDRTTSNGMEFVTSSDVRHMNGSVKRRCVKENGVCHSEHIDKLDKHIAHKERDKHSQNGGVHTHSHTHSHAHTNGCAKGAGAPHEDDKHENSKGNTKSKSEKREANSIREERKKHKNRDKDKESIEIHKVTENSKEHNNIPKEKELEINTKECVKHRDSCSNKDKERERENREREKDREYREREREREIKEKERREREERVTREYCEELKRVRAELSVVRGSEAEARRALAAAAANERQRRAEHTQLKHAHAALQHKMTAWRSNERAAHERRLSEERRAQSHCKHSSGECENEWCKSRLTSHEAEAASLRRELQRVRERADRLQRDLAHATDQVRTLEVRHEEAAANANACSRTNASAASAWQALQERATHLERSLSAETRVKLDLLSALGDAKRHMHIQEGLISRQEKEIEELKAQMLAVMPTEFVTPVSGTVSKLRLSDGSPLDPNASVYTPKQLCSDA